MLVFAGGFVYELNRQGIQFFGKIVYKDSNKVCFSAAIAPVELIAPHDCLLLPSDFLSLLGAFFIKNVQMSYRLYQSLRRGFQPAGIEP